MTAGPDWHDESFPELRPGPPWVMEEMIAAGPALAEPLLGAEIAGVREVAEAIAAASGRGELVVVTGCGTSEHAACAVAAVLRAARPSGGSPPAVIARNALDEAVDPWAAGVCLGVSHDGGTRATMLALEAARARGAVTALLTARAGAQAAATADITIVTPAVDRSWCHTLAYDSAILAGAAIARELGLAGVEAEPAAALLARHGELAQQAHRPAEALAGRRVIVAVGTGADHVTARELALKIAEGARQATVAFDVETILHGHLAGHEADSGLVLVALGAGERVRRRAGLVASAVAEIGMPVAALLSPEADAELAGELTPAGRIVVGPPPGLDATLYALAGGAVALQVLTLALAHARGTNPDLIRREEAPYRAAAQAAEQSTDW